MFSAFHHAVFCQEFSPSLSHTLTLPLYLSHTLSLSISPTNDLPHSLPTSCQFIIQFYEILYVRPFIIINVEGEKIHYYGAAEELNALESPFFYYKFIIMCLNSLVFNFLRIDYCTHRQQMPISKAMLAVHELKRSGSGRERKQF